jgi:hypothetical protein
MQNPFFTFLAALLGWFRERPWRIVVTGVVAGVVGIVSQILPPSLFQSFNCDLQNLPQSSQSSNGFFIDNQVIVIGEPEQVDDVIGPPGAAEPRPVTLTLIEGCDLSYLNTRKVSGADTSVETRKLVMRLYEIPATEQGAEAVNNDQRVEDVIAAINEAAQGISAEIAADPNYLTRLSDLTSDPCGLAGDGGGNGGRPFGGPGTLTLDPEAYSVVRAENVFRDQWAFGDQGINMPNETAATLPAMPTGSDVRVGVFDTSPYRISFPFIKRVAEALPSPLWFPNWDAGGTTIASSHGLFVASLIHQMAPNSRVQLIRVLYEDGCGELWVLNKGLEDYTSRMSAWTERLDKTVINLSLGIRVKGSLETTDQEDEELGTLTMLLDEADKMGAIIIAAAGNDSKNTRSGGIVVEDMQIPANMVKVIGVAATNNNANRSCYSSRGDVAAPGGEGGTDLEDPANLCASRATTWDKPADLTSGPICSDPAKCPYILISLAVTRYGEQFVGWTGSSFSAPLVSGLAALVYEKQTQAFVKCVIEHGATRNLDSDLGWGIINVENTLSMTTCSP